MELTLDERMALDTELAANCCAYQEFMRHPFVDEIMRHARSVAKMHKESAVNLSLPHDVRERESVLYHVFTDIANGGLFANAGEYARERIVERHINQANRERLLVSAAKGVDRSESGSREPFGI